MSYYYCLITQTGCIMGCITFHQQTREEECGDRHVLPKMLSIQLCTKQIVSSNEFLCCIQLGSTKSTRTQFFWWMTSLAESWRCCKPIILRTSAAFMEVLLTDYKYKEWGQFMRRRFDIGQPNTAQQYSPIFCIDYLHETRIMKRSLL